MTQTTFFSPTVLTSDFELGILNTIGKCFPDAQRSGCFFHFVQCQIRNFGSMGLLKKEKKKKTYELLVLINFLCFVETKKIKKIFQEIKKKYDNDDEYQKYFEYFEKTWINGYNKELWNHYTSYDLMQDSFKMTNNILESFHSLLLHLNQNSYQPSLGVFTSSLVYIESRQVNDFNRMENKTLIKVKNHYFYVEFLGTKFNWSIFCEAQRET